ncbi:MAG: hypothetical protein M5U34_46160 [Chloroflexi bacterium]|nr:hypothetical protein [Chloroflexota bacterium]
MSDSEKEDRLLSIKQAAQYLDISTEQVYHIIKTERVPTTMVEVVIQVRRKLPHISLNDLEKYKRSRWKNKHPKKSSSSKI